MNDDQGFEFQPPVDKRPPKAFEPPPWEKEAFDELQRRRSEEAEARTALEQQKALEQQAAERSAGPDEEPAEDAPEVEVAGTAEPATSASGASVPDSVVLEMMAGLAAEEPRANEAYQGVALGTGLFLAALGGVLVVWSIAALAGARVTGWIGQVTGAGLGMFGLFFFGMGVWLLYRTLKQRGVL